MNEPNSRDYARDAEAARTRLNQKLGELHDGVSPGRVLDEVLSYGKNGGTLFLKALNNAARENPIPTMLIGAGCAMFLSEKTGLTGLMSRAAADDKPDAEDKAGAQARSAKTNGGSLAKGLKDGVHDVAGALGDGAAKVGEVAGGIATTVTHGVQSAVEGVGDQIAKASDRTKEQASKTARLLKDRADAFMQDQPLLAAAIGVAIGALIATAFPATELEDGMMGETSDAVKETLGDAASEQLDAAKSAVAAVADQAKSAAEREGLTPAAVADAARDLGQRIGRVVSDTADAATTEVKERA